MRTLNRNKMAIWYALCTGRTAIKDAYNNETGEYTLGYADPVKIGVSASVASGTTNSDFFGRNPAGSRVLVMENPDCPITETSKLWVEVVPTIEIDGSTNTPHDYIVNLVGKSINGISYRISKVNVG